MSHDLEDKEPFFDPILGDRVECDIPWLVESPREPVQSALREAATLVREEVQDRLQRLMRDSPLAFAVMGGFRA